VRPAPPIPPCLHREVGSVRPRAGGGPSRENETAEETAPNLPLLPRSNRGLSQRVRCDKFLSDQQDQRPRSDRHCSGARRSSTVAQAQYGHVHARFRVNQHARFVSWNRRRELGGRGALMPAFDSEPQARASKLLILRRFKLDLI